MRLRIWRTRRVVLFSSPLQLFIKCYQTVCAYSSVASYPINSCAINYCLLVIQTNIVVVFIYIYIYIYIYFVKLVSNNAYKFVFSTFNSISSTLGWAYIIPNDDPYTLILMCPQGTKLERRARVSLKKGNKFMTTHLLGKFHIVMDIS